MTKSAHKDAPLQSRLRIVWFLFTVFVSAIWTRVYFDNNLHAKRCFVRENASDGTYQMLNYLDEGVLKHDNIKNVSGHFEFLSMCYLAQGLGNLFCAGYQLTAIYLVNSLLMYSVTISRVNKLFLAYGVYTLVMTHIYRLDESGKVCSGDYLSDEERLDPQVTQNYLIETGNLFWYYMQGIWLISIFAAIAGVVIGYDVYTTFV